MPHNPKEKHQKKKAVNKLNQAARYSGIAFEMFFIILAGVYGGIKLDEKVGTTHVFTAVLSIIAVFAAIYLVIKDLLK
jgi:F0F1-type ATP synthase assembly protein I